YATNARNKHRCAIEEAVPGRARLSEKSPARLQHHYARESAFRALRSALPSIVNYHSRRDIVRFPSSDPGFVADIDILGVHEVVAAEHPNAFEGSATHHQAGTRHRIDLARGF